ncbi:hypothetical protein AJ80_00146 [Polytolypa hystricis UAMH7299]|uniref:SHSP domain-containing protein n=1 Tax=Polytolypa hystricis (strain UAMH7299) TaxID=1447883 RepID=A0A2B7Z3T3_POLH7|nr:hypothetical protein AJ80_00146 [Polytolypa hystricis UAMH7299]
MTNFYILNQPSHPMFDFLSDIRNLYGIPGFTQPPPYTSREHMDQPRTQQESQHQDAEPQQSSQAPTQDQAESPSAEGCAETNNAEDGQESGATHDIPFRGRRGRSGHRSRGGCGRGRAHPAHPWGAHHLFRRHRCRFRGCCPAFEGPDAGSNEQRGPGNNFVPLSFLHGLGNHFGMNLDNMFGASTNNPEIDFVPRADLFDTRDRYIVHVSLPGAQKQDLSVDYDTEASTLHLAGVVYRPGVDEAMINALVVDGRARDVGVFRREVRLGTRAEPARVDIDNISAKLVDGVLVVVLPKVAGDEGEFRRRVSVQQDVKGKGKEKKSEADLETDTMLVDSETEIGDEAMYERKTLSPTYRDEDEEERDYITVDVD